ncbi:hypothetical protein HOLDEFILI_03410 [Holdemania filiformis DSM 12042]|uniref:Uncharacterized protein n=1 Tax=Holdemania filiformis DSM 12042 TaxID=545696 RepID=B9YC51_9FIRM|nr:hypothetical protein HOLDEFILI_03410 [Holdemania filiformis DSM 12042]
MNVLLISFFAYSRYIILRFCESDQRMESIDLSSGDQKNEIVMRLTPFRIHE